MISSTISYTKNHLSELISSVRKGETLIIMDRKKPVARVERIESLEDHPHLNPPEKPWNPRQILDLPLAESVREEASLSRALAEERESGW